MKTITIRVDEAIFQQIEARRGEASKSDFYRNILIEYISNKSENALNKPEDDLESSEYVLNIRKENETLRTDASHKDAMLVLKDDRIKDLQKPARVFAVRVPEALKPALQAPARAQEMVDVLEITIILYLATYQGSL